MIAKIVHSKSIRAILSYNELKVRRGEARLLLAAGYLSDPEQLSFQHKLERFEKLTALNERTRTNAMHIILSFSARDRLDDNLLQSIAFQYMEGIGFGDQPFLLYRHYDTYNAHIHLATVNITREGKRIETHNIGRNQSEATRKLLEELYGLVRAEDQKRQEGFVLEPARLQKAEYGKYETKATISAIVREVVGTYKFSSLPELNAVLRQFNVMAYRGAPGTQMYQKGGLVYSILDDQGLPVSIPIKASSIFSTPTLKNLEKKFVLGETERKPYGQRLRHQLDKALAAAKDLEDYKRRLQQQGIRVLLRLGVTGEVYGATFIDNSTRVVYNGSSLGKGYGAKGFLEKLSAKGFSRALFDPEAAAEGPSGSRAGEEPEAGEKPLVRRPVIEVVREEAGTEGLDGVGPGPFKYRRRRRLRPE